jgi:hypothetical protein
MADSVRAASARAAHVRAVPAMADFVRAAPVKAVPAKADFARA